MQRSKSTPNVGVQPTETERPQAPRRTKTTTDFKTLSPQSAVHQEKCGDAFNLAGFFPSSLRSPDEEQSNWWRDDDSGDNTEEPISIAGDGYSSSHAQRILFSREDKSTQAIIEGEDKLGVLTICMWSRLLPRAVEGTWHSWSGEVSEERLNSPYTGDEACDEEALRLAHERRRQESWDDGSHMGEKTGQLFYGGEEEEEAGGWTGLMRM
ncbi:hypothetical protein BC834DRAFT_839818 [Gloeopeniophorella convolvens]|nr:hypothetical protein BC834DRAFT_839818 [Gloeopeniophorella convolvens]